jgi:hypothetical protein
MKLHLLLAALLGLATLPIAFSTATPVAIEKPAVGADAPDITAPTWFNHLGRTINKNNLGGNAVLVEFWATW